LLATALGDATAGGDFEAARIVHEAIAKLLSTAAVRDPSVVPLARRGKASDASDHEEREGHVSGGSTRRSVS
jgi:hypothetical protein